MILPGIGEDLKAADRDRYLSVLYAPAAVRPALFALHALDLELARLVATTTEPMIGEIRLAWWREALTGLDAGRIPAQPLLTALATELLPRGVSGTVLAGFEDAFIEQLHGSDSGAARGAALFAAAASVLGGDVEQGRSLGRRWGAGAPLPPGVVPATLRPLAGLAAVAHRQFEHPTEPRGSVVRQWILFRVNILDADKPLKPRYFPTWGNGGRAMIRAWVLKFWRWGAIGTAAILLVVAGAMWGRSNPHASMARLIGHTPASAQDVPAPADSAEPLVAPVSDVTPLDKEAKRFRRYDKDRDGKISRDEYFVARHKAFAKLDVNGDGKLSFEEYSVKAIAKFSGADANKDGILTATEFATTAVVRHPRNKPVCPPGAVAAIPAEAEAN